MRIDGFTDDDIDFAVKWTLENAKEKPYDFSFIKHTISQANAERKEYEEKERIKVEKEAKKALQEEDNRKSTEKSEYLGLVKEKMTPEEREKLKNEAVEIAKSEGIREDFLDQNTINALENEILAKRGHYER